MESDNSKNELDQILEENKRLRAKIQLLEGKETLGKTVKKSIGRFGTNFFLGKGLKRSFLRLFEEIPTGKVQRVTLADVSSHLVWRLTRVGIFTLCLITTDENSIVSNIGWVEFDPILHTLKRVDFNETIELDFNKSLLKNFPLECQ